MEKNELHLSIDFLGLGVRHGWQDANEQDAVLFIYIGYIFCFVQAGSNL